VNGKHNLLAKKLDEEVNSLVRTQGERQPTKKKQNVFSFEFFSKKFTKCFYKNDEMQHKQFIENLTLLIIKSHLHVHFLETSWLKRFAL